MRRSSSLSALVAGAFLPGLLLAGCSASDNPDFGLTPPAPIGSTGSVGTTTAMPPVAVEAQRAPSARRVALAETTGPVQFLPLVGAPPQTVAVLSQALAASAAENGVTIIPSSDPVAPLRLKGYLSAMAEGSGTVVVYVWDIVDPQGIRVNRIQGQEKINAAAADPWSVVGKDALARIASETLTEFRRLETVAG